MSVDIFFRFLGIIFLMMTACLDAFGYNIQRRDHCKNAVSSKPRHECFRKYWHLGLYIYISSLIVGNIAAMSFVPPHWVAPITTTSLIFNIVFARILVGTKITRRDIIGTSIIILSIVSIVFLTTLHDPSQQSGIDLSLDELEYLYSQLSFKLYSLTFNGIMLAGFVLYLYLVRLIKDPIKLATAPVFISRTDPKVIAKNTALLVSILGGMGASVTVILAKSGVSLIIVAFTDQWPFFNKVPLLVVFGLGLSAAFQLYCLNAGLKLADSVVVGPIFSSIYNIFALMNALVFLDQFKIYKPWILFLFVVGISMLILGIVVLAKQVKPEPERLPRLPRFKCTRRKDKSSSLNLINSKENLSESMVSV